MKEGRKSEKWEGSVSYMLSLTDGSAILIGVEPASCLLNTHLCVFSFWCFDESQNVHFVSGLFPVIKYLPCLVLFLKMKNNACNVLPNIWLKTVLSDFLQTNSSFFSVCCCRPQPNCVVIKEGWERGSDTSFKAATSIHQSPLMWKPGRRPSQKPH